MSSSVPIWILFYEIHFAKINGLHIISVRALYSLNWTFFEKEKKKTIWIFPIVIPLWIDNEFMAIIIEIIFHLIRVSRNRWKKRRKKQIWNRDICIFEYFRFTNERLKKSLNSWRYFFPSFRFPVIFNLKRNLCKLKKEEIATTTTKQNPIK